MCPSYLALCVLTTWTMFGFLYSFSISVFVRLLNSFGTLIHTKILLKILRFQVSKLFSSLSTSRIHRYQWAVELFGTLLLFLPFICSSKSLKTFPRLYSLSLVAVLFLFLRRRYTLMLLLDIQYAPFSLCYIFYVQHN